MSPQDQPTATTFRPRLFWCGIAGLCAVIGGLSWLMSSMLRLERDRGNTLPKYAQMQSHLEGIERGGSPVNTSALRGKVRVFASLYTICPHGCAAVMGQMRKLHLEHGSRDDFQQVSITVVPERDTPQILAAYADGLDVGPAPNWWFITGQQSILWDFMVNGLGLNKPEPIPEDERLNPLDIYSHDLRIVLVDREGWVRGYYEVFHPQPEIGKLMCAKLEEDLRHLLDDPDL